MDLKGKNVVVLAANYIYEGVLDHETHDRVYLSSARIVYATGPWAEAKRAKGGDVKWRNAEALPVKLLGIERSAVESIGELSI